MAKKTTKRAGLNGAVQSASPRSVFEALKKLTIAQQEQLAEYCFCDPEINWVKILAKVLSDEAKRVEHGAAKGAQFTHNGKKRHPALDSLVLQMWQSGEFTEGKIRHNAGVRRQNKDKPLSVGQFNSITRGIRKGSKKQLFSTNQK